MGETTHQELGLKELLSFSIPSIVASMLEPLSGIVDSSLVGKISTEWLGALAVATIILSSCTWVFNFLIHASTQSISMSSAGESSRDLASRIKISFYSALIVGIISAVILYVSRFFFYELAGAPVELIATTDSYFKVRVYGHLFVLLYMTLVSVLRGLGHVKASFYILVFTTVLNVFSSYHLLYILNTDITGAAWGTNFANVMGSLICLIMIFKDPRVIKSELLKRVKVDQFFTFTKNSMDIFGRSLFLTICFFLATRLAGLVSVKALAAHHVLMQAWLFCSFFIDGIAITGNIYGARLLGEKRVDLIKVLEKNLVLISLFIGLAFALIYILFQYQIVTLFTNDDSLYLIISSLWLLLAVSQIFLAPTYVYDGLLFGVSKFRYLRIEMIKAVVLVYAPISLLSLHFKQLWPVWAGLISLGVYRFYTGRKGVKKLFKEYGV